MKIQKKILKHFNVPFAIENPAYALSQYVLKEFEKNDLNYCRYGMKWKKTTSIYTNFRINFLRCNHKGTHTSGISAIHSRVERARVPTLLIIIVIMHALVFSDDLRHKQMQLPFFTKN